MKMLFRLFLLLLFLGGWGLAAASLYVVRVREGLVPVLLVPRDRVARGIDEFKQTYTDVRQWTLDDVAEHRALVRRMIEVGDAEYLKHTTHDGPESVEAQLAEVVQGAGEPRVAQHAGSPVKLAQR